jgi:hypothetical protein
MRADVVQRHPSQGEKKDQNGLDPVETGLNQDGAEAGTAQPSEKTPVPETPFDKSVKLSTLAANLVVVVGIFFAFYQFTQSDAAEKRRLAIEAVSQTRSAEFLRAYADLRTAYHDGRVEGDPIAVRDNVNFVMSVYDHIALLYINDLADRCVIKNSVHPAVKDLLPICDAMRYPEENREHVNKLFKLMEQERCE